MVAKKNISPPLGDETKTAAPPAEGQIKILPGLIDSPPANPAEESAENENEMNYEDAMNAPAAEILSLVPSANDVQRMRQLLQSKSSSDFYKWDKPCEFSMLLEGIGTTKSGIPLAAGWATFRENGKSLPQRHIKITLPTGFVTQIRNKAILRGDIMYVKHLGLCENKIRPESGLIRSFVIDKL